MPISALPTPPSRIDAPQDFSDRADALLGALPTFVSEANALQADVNASESSASSYATIATNKAAEAQGYATTATTKASEAAASAVAAAAAASNAESAFDSFDDKYLGSKASDPATDNDGNPLLTGALYWNTTVNEMRVWNGSAWQAAAGSLVGMPETAQELAGGVDLNTIQTPGFYVQSHSAEAASGTNYPVATAGALVVLKNASGVSQLYYTYGSASDAPRAFFRAVYSGSWSPWREVYHSGNLGDAFKGANQSLSTNGYQRLPGGIIIQWGVANLGSNLAAAVGASTIGSITFPITFPNSPLSASVVGYAPGSTAYEEIENFLSVQTLTASNLTVVATRVFGSGSSIEILSVAWICLGY